MGKPTTKTEILITILKENNQQHVSFDSLGRPSIIYTALEDALDGDPCHVREYIYYGVTTKVKGRKEGYGVWSSAYDPINNQVVLTDDLSNILTDDLGSELTT